MADGGPAGHWIGISEPENIYRKISWCYSKCKKSGDSDTAATNVSENSKKTDNKDNVVINIPKETSEKVEFHRTNTGGDWPDWSPEESRKWDQHDSRILSTIENLRSKYETDTGKNSANTDTVMSREKSLKELDRDMTELATVRERAVKDSVTE